MKTRYVDKVCYMDTESFIFYIKTNNILVDIAKDVETRFDTPNYDLGRPLLKEKNKKVILSMKDELGVKKMADFAALRPKTYSYLTDSNNVNKKARGTKKYVIKQKIKFQDYKYCLEATQVEMK